MVIEKGFVLHCTQSDTRLAREPTALVAKGIPLSWTHAVLRFERIYALSAVFRGIIFGPNTQVVYTGDGLPHGHCEAHERFSIFFGLAD